jgi:hypothetical protein
MECAYCKKTFKNEYIMKTHITTSKKCISLQAKLGVKINKITFPCIYCKKDFTSKRRCDNHLILCKYKIKADSLLDVKNKKEEIDVSLQKTKEDINFSLQKTKEDVSSEIKSLREKVVFLEKELGSLREEFNLLREKVNSTTNKSTKPTTQSQPPTQSPTQSQPPTDKLSKKPIPKAIKTIVWNLYIGSSIAESTCMCCKQEKITIREFQCGHVLAEANGGDMNISNLRPICNPCNKSMGTQHMGEFVKTFFGRELV